MADEHVRLLHGVEVPHTDLAVLASSIDGVVSHREAIDLLRVGLGVGVRHRLVLLAKARQWTSEPNSIPDPTPNPSPNRGSGPPSLTLSLPLPLTLALIEAVDLRAGIEGEDELHQLEVPHLDIYGVRVKVRVGLGVRG